jgi:hypothetical protein
MDPVATKVAPPTTKAVLQNGERPGQKGGPRGSALEPWSSVQAVGHALATATDGEPSLTKSKVQRVKQRAEDRLGLDGVAQLVADYRAGHSTKWLQRTYSLSQGAVLRLLDVNGVPRRQRGLTTEQVQEAIRLYGQGWSLTRIGDRFNKDHTVVRNALLRSGVRIRGGHGHCG